jgi:hypothetical protein
LIANPDTFYLFQSTGAAIKRGASQSVMRLFTIRATTLAVKVYVIFAVFRFSVCDLSATFGFSCADFTFSIVLALLPISVLQIMVCGHGPGREFLKDFLSKLLHPDATGISMQTSHSLTLSYCRP